MERVSFEVAKYLKEVGYPQSEYGHHYYTNGVSCYGVLLKDINIYAPTYIDVWLWLCNKGIVFYPAIYPAHEPSGWSCYYRDNIRVIDIDTFGVHNNPEKSIESAIKYLVEHHLIK